MLTELNKQLTKKDILDAGLMNITLRYGQEYYVCSFRLFQMDLFVFCLSYADNENAQTNFQRAGEWIIIGLLYVDYCRINFCVLDCGLQAHSYARINWMMGPLYVGWRKTATKLSLLWMEIRLMGITYNFTIGKRLKMLYKMWTALWGFGSTGVLGAFCEASLVCVYAYWVIHKELYKNNSKTI